MRSCLAEGEERLEERKGGRMRRKEGKGRSGGKKDGVGESGDRRGREKQEEMKKD